MPLPKDIDFESEIELNQFRLSKEWQTIEGILFEARADWIAVCLDNTKSLEEIRYAQGALAMIETFSELPERIFKGEVKDNGKHS